MPHSRFALAPVPQFGATLALLIAAYSTPVLAIFDLPHDVAAPSAGRASVELQAAAASAAEPSQAPRYTCPMHPAVDSDKPGLCPHCGMKLEEKKRS